VGLFAEQSRSAESTERWCIEKGRNINQSRERSLQIEIFKTIKEEKKTATVFTPSISEAKVTYVQVRLAVE